MVCGVGLLPSISELWCLNILVSLSCIRCFICSRPGLQGRIQTKTKGRGVTGRPSGNMGVWHAPKEILKNKAFWGYSEGVTDTQTPPPPPWIRPCPTYKCRELLICNARCELECFNPLTTGSDYIRFLFFISTINTSF